MDALLLNGLQLVRVDAESLQNGWRDLLVGHRGFYGLLVDVRAGAAKPCCGCPGELWNSRSPNRPGSALIPLQECSLLAKIVV